MATRNSIDRRVRATQSFDVSDECGKLALESSHIGIWDLNPLTRSLVWSKRAKVLAGLPADAEVDVDVFLSCVHPEDRENVEREIERVLQPNETKEWYIEFRTIGIADQVQRWVWVRGKAFFERKRPVRFVGTAMDITNEKRKEEELLRLARDLARSNVNLEEFAAILSHDLKEPLRTVTSFLRLISDRSLIVGEDGREFLGYALSAATQMKALIGGLLSFARETADDGQFCHVDTAGILQNVIKRLKILIDENQAQITFSVLPRVWGDELRLGQVFQNLIANAIQHRGAEAPRVHVLAEAKGGEWLFSIRDNGIGFSPENRERIFLLFQRLQGERGGKGPGVGLAICRKFIESHGGRIWAESEPNKGSVFYFTLPATRM